MQEKPRNPAPLSELVVAVNPPPICGRPNVTVSRLYAEHRKLAV
ncbi:hypothetical protein AA0111_g10319 [Alternaria arborescens]|nr:hypothetical protein AA0111_g10319 [Alternaria arborescens]RYO19807.1 hypothetical protein AA0111_g10319 [Alternaria arborescens]